MKLLLLLALVHIITIVGTAQTRETFDLTSYIPPEGWSKSTNPNVVSYTITDKSTGSWCQVGIYKSADSKGSIQQDFEKEWKDLIADPYKITDSPWVSEIAEADGWKIKGGGGKFTFNSKNAAAVLTTFSGYGKVVSIVTITNCEIYNAAVQNLISSVELIKPHIFQATDIKPEVVIGNNEVRTTNSGSYAFNTSNFDDGWVAKQKEDWVEVTRGSTKVLIHYPNKITNEYIPDKDLASSTAWNNLVAPRYSNLKNYFVFNSCLDSEQPKFLSGDATENSSGKSVFVVLFKRGKSGWIEFVCSDKASFINNFTMDLSKLDFYMDSQTWEPLKKMSGYNKFAVAASDFNGKWTSDFSSIQQYVNVYTGNDAGMSSYQSKQDFEFGNGNTYKWSLSVATGMVGNIKGETIRSAGNFALLSNWQVNFSDMEGKSKTFDAYFSCVKGSRLLWLSNTAYPEYIAFGKVN